MSTEEIIKKANKILEEASLPDRHTFFQIEKFIVGKEVTGQAQLWQIIREIDTRVQSIENIEKQLYDAEDELEMFDIKIRRKAIDLEVRKSDKNVGPFGIIEVVGEEYPLNVECKQLQIQELEIDIRKLEREKEALVKTARRVQHKLKSVIEEVDCFIQAYGKVMELCGELKPLDDYKAQAELWNEKLLEEYNLRVLLGKPLDISIVKTIMSLDNGAQVKRHLTGVLNNLQNQMLEKQQTQQTQQNRIETRAKVSGPKPEGRGHVTEVIDKLIPEGKGQKVMEIIEHSHGIISEHNKEE